MVIKPDPVKALGHWSHCMTRTLIKDNKNRHDRYKLIHHTVIKFFTIPQKTPKKESQHNISIIHQHILQIQIHYHKVYYDVVLGFFSEKTRKTWPRSRVIGLMLTRSGSYGSNA